MWMWMWMCPSYRCRWPQRVLINSDGDMIVRPSFIEAAVQRRSTSSVAHHLLVNYQRAHIAVIKAQFTSKRFRDGMAVSSCMTNTVERAGPLQPAGPPDSGLRSAHAKCGTCSSTHQSPQRQPVADVVLLVITAVQGAVQGCGKCLSICA